jgi:hypothetical protein
MGGFQLFIFSFISIKLKSRRGYEASLAKFDSDKA